MTMSIEELRELLSAGRDALAALSFDERRRFRDSLPQPLPGGTTTTEVDAGGVPAEWLARAGAIDGRAVLYLHGGGYTVGSPRSHRSLAARIGVAADADCLVVDYRLAPEHPHPAALDDALAAYRWLVEQVGSPDGVVVAGDSAGGGLAVALLLALRAHGDWLPAAAVLLAPWVDMELKGESIRSCRDLDASLTEQLLQESVDAYVGDGSPTNPLVSPLHGDLSGLPPLLVQVGDWDLLRDDAVRLAAKAQEAGVDATVEVWPGMPHVFQTFAGVLPESADALDQIAVWLTERFDDSGDDPRPGDGSGEAA